MRTIARIVTIAIGAVFLNALPAAGEDDLVVAQAGQSTTRPATKRHSHFQEKTGAPQLQAAADRTPDRPNPWKDYSRHFHPRDR